MIVANVITYVYLLVLNVCQETANMAFSLSLNTVYHNIKKDKRVDFWLPYLNKYNTIAHF